MAKFEKFKNVFISLFRSFTKLIETILDKISDVMSLYFFPVTTLEQYFKAAMAHSSEFLKDPR